jgi:hypothetical protein
MPWVNFLTNVTNIMLKHCRYLLEGNGDATVLGDCAGAVNCSPHIFTNEALPTGEAGFVGAIIAVGYVAPPTWRPQFLTLVRVNVTGASVRYYSLPATSLLSNQF